MKVGSIVYCSVQGLGILAKSFYDNGVITHPCILEHHCRTNHWDWYPSDTPVCRRPDGYNIAHEWVKTLDVFLVFETPFDWSLISTARANGVKVVMVPMYECMPAQIPVLPNKWICPSLLDYRYYPRENGRDSIHLPIPVDIPWKQRTRAKRFIHNSGNGGLLGRNGTRELVDSLAYISCDAEIVIRTQEFDQYIHDECARQSNRIDVHYSSGPIAYADLFTEGDVFVFPEKFNGLSLPIQEAYASGMLVMATNRFPNDQYLPKEPLIPVGGVRSNRVSGAYNWFQESIVWPRAIADTINAWYDRDITDYSLQGKAYAEANSWEVLKPHWMEALLCVS